VDDRLSTALLPGLVGRVAFRVDEPLATVPAPKLATLVVTERRNWWVRSRAWVALLIMLPFAAAAVLSRPVALEGSWLNLEFDAVGWVLFMIGGGIRWWATLHIGGRKLDILVADGPYSVCRNPLYVGTILIGVGVAFFLQSLTFAAGFGVAAVFYLAVTVPVEEARLLARFGESFLSYCRRVPRYWPRFKNFHSPEQITVSVRGLAAEAIRAARWIWLPAICEAAAHLRGEEWWPRLFHLP
jgi:protein-S-isoprenylcysteine O-methyltransferase Ste14